MKKMFALLVFSTSLDNFEQLEHGQTKRIGNNLNSIECRVGIPVLNSAQIGLVKTALFSELYLTQAGLLAQRADTRAKLLR